jgi:hypothetical protein
MRIKHKNVTGKRKLVFIYLEINNTEYNNNMLRSVDKENLLKSQGHIKYAASTKLNPL